MSTITGTAGDDLISGTPDKDVIDGGAGNDTLFGDSGDTLLGGDGADTLNFASVSTDGVANGGAGDDKLNLGGGAYQLTGGAGADTFTALYPSHLGVNTITDFRLSEGDRLSFGFGPFNTRVFRGQLDNPNFTLQAGQAFSNNDYGPEVVQVWTWTSGGYTYLIADKDGSGELSDGDFIVRFSGQLVIGADAFVDTTFTLKIDGTSGADNYVGTSGKDTYYAIAGDDVLHGGDGDDFLVGGAGNDEIWGDNGADGLFGGAGTDTAAYAGLSTDYKWTPQSDGSWIVESRPSAAFLTDTIRGFEILKFSDKSVILPLHFSQDVEVAFSNILRAWIDDRSQVAAAQAVATLVDNGVSASRAIAEIVTRADATTSVASMAYQFFTGKIPGQAGIDYLVSPTGPNPNNLNSAYYQSFNLENRYINFAVNLGKVGEGKDAFAAHYGALSLFEATREAYREIFGAAPADAKVHALIDTRVDYFASYGGDGANGIGTKAAMVGWLLAEAEKADLGVMARSNNAWLTDLADYSAPFAVNILDPANGYYKTEYVFGG